MRAALLGAALLAACTEPDDTLFTRPVLPPLEISPGLFRATWHAGADVVRGFTADGARIVYLSHDLPGFGGGSYVLSVGVTDGVVTEEASLYRRALLDTVSHVVLGPATKVLVTWRAPEEAAVSCPGCPPPPPVIDVTLLRLPATDIVPLSSVTARGFRIPNHATSDCQHRVRIRPVEEEVRSRRVNPFGPVERADGSAGFFSDGETLWRYDLTDPAAPADSIGPGAFPALSSDGLRLAAAVPLGLDSTSGQCVGGLCCQQETVTITATGWQTILYDLAGGAGAAVAAGLEPVFDPLEARLVVRRPDGLYWVTLATGDATLITGTDGGYAPALSPDGALLAFTAGRFDNPDVFFVRIR